MKYSEPSKNCEINASIIGLLSGFHSTKHFATFPGGKFPPCPCLPTPMLIATLSHFTFKIPSYVLWSSGDVVFIDRKVCSLWYVRLCDVWSSPRFFVCNVRCNLKLCFSFIMFAAFVLVGWWSRTAVTMALSSLEPDWDICLFTVYTRPQCICYTNTSLSSEVCVRVSRWLTFHRFVDRPRKLKRRHCWPVNKNLIIK